MNCVLVAFDGAKGSQACVAACARLIDKLMLGDVAQQVASGAAVPVLLAR